MLILFQFEVYIVVRYNIRFKSKGVRDIICSRFLPLCYNWFQLELEILFDLPIQIQLLTTVSSWSLNSGRYFQCHTLLYTNHSMPLWQTFSNWVSWYNDGVWHGCWHLCEVITINASEFPCEVKLYMKNIWHLIFFKTIGNFLLSIINLKVTSTLFIPFLLASF